MTNAMKTMHLCCILSVILVLPISLYAREQEDWTLTNFNNENGLPQNSVKFVEMDKDGYLWMVTESGIVRYDGKSFRLFDNSNSLLTRNRYSWLGKNSDGNIYCIDDKGNIAYYNNKSRFSKPVDLRYLVPATTAGIIDLDRPELEKLAPFTGTYRPRLSRNYFYHATGRNKGFMVMTSGDTVVSGYISGGRVRRVDTLKDFHLHIYRAFADIDGKLCYISQNRDIVLIDSNGVRSHQKIPVAVPWNKLRMNALPVSFFRQEHQLLLDVDGDIYEVGFTGERLVLHLIVHATDIPDIYCVRHYPEQGLLAIGSTSRGLFLFKKKQLAFVGKNNKEAGSFYALAPYSDNHILTSSGIFPGYRPVPGISEAVGRHSILHDRHGHYWYSTGAELWNTDDKFRVLKKVPLTRRLMCLQEDDQGTVWMSGEACELGRIQRDTIQFYKLDSTKGKSIYSFIPAGDQTFWVVGTGLFLWLDVKHHRQRIYHEFDSIELRTVYRDKQGSLWLGSYGQGYFLFRNGRFTKMPEDERHYLKIVHCFLEDRKGFIWMTTNNGLFQCAVNDLYRYATGKTEEVYHYYYGKESGMNVSEFNGGCTPSGLQLDNGQFAFPSVNGVVLFYPDSTRPLLPTEKVFIDQVLLDGVPVQESDLSKIPPSFKRLELTVSSPYFGTQNNLNIEYNIDGLDDHWYPLGDNNRIVLNQLKYGHYTIRLRKEAGFGTGNYVTAGLPLVVMPFFYQTWWFRIAVSIGVLLLILLFIRLRYKYLIHQRNRLEAEVKDRTHALVYHNKLLEKLTVMIAHDLKSPLHFLSKVTGHLRSNVQQEDLRGIDRTSNEIKHTADQAYQFIEAFNLWVSSFNEGFAINNATFLLDDLLQELQLFFKEMMIANGNRLLIVTPAHYTLHTDRELLKVVLRNILDNANKHARPCDIRISVHAETEQQIAITIADTGAGMARPVLKRIQGRIAQASTAAGIERNSRMGYQMIIDFVTHLTAKLDVQSEPGKGTTVTLRIRGKASDTSPSRDLAKQVVSAG